MEEITKRLHERFPLLKRLTVQSVEVDSAVEPLPRFLGLMLAVMASEQNTPLCFILPRRGDIGRLATVLHALQLFANKQKSLTKSYGEENFREGDRVRVHPSKHVFTYGGFSVECPECIWLRTLDAKGGWLVRAADVVTRLEKTSLCRPIGRLDSPLHSPPPVMLDILLETSCFGNHSIMKNEVVLFDSLSGLTAFTESVSLQIEPPTPDTITLKALIPFGEVLRPADANEAWFRKWDERNPNGEPLVAVTNSIELLANYCIKACSFTKLVVINDLSRLRNLQAYDDIAQTQRLVLFADHDDEEMIEALRNRGCRFWHLDREDLLGDSDGASSRGIVGMVNRWIHNYMVLCIDDEPCENQQIEKICLQLETLRCAVEQSGEGPLTRLVSHAWRMFSDARTRFASPSQSEWEQVFSDVGSFRLELERNRVWIPHESAQTLVEIADSIIQCYETSANLGVSKGMALYHALSKEVQTGNKVALLARNENKVGTLRQWIHHHRFDGKVAVYSPRTLPEGEDFSRLIFVSWPGGDAMKQVASKLTAPRVTVIGYPCERRWLRQCQSRFTRRCRVPSLSGAEKASYISGTAEPSISWPEGFAPSPTRTIPSSNFDVWNFEVKLRVARIGLAARPTDATETVQARYVRFAGESYSFLTESHKIPVATELLSGRVRLNQKLPERTVIELKSGDFVVFPESGDSEFVQELADKLIGPNASELRKVARGWKEALQKSGITPAEFQSQAHDLQRFRHPATIRHWFADTSQIGPREKDDLVLIALVTGDQQLEAEIDNVRQAIEQLWSTHLSAGMRLRDALLQRLPLFINQVEENGTKVDLGEIGSAWIVQVETISSSAEPRGRGEVNRLLFEASNSNSTHLL